MPSSSATPRGALDKAPLIGYLMPEKTPSESDSAILHWLESQKELSAQQIFLAEIKSAAALASCQAVWVHIPGASAYRKWKKQLEQVRHLKSYFEAGGSLLLTHYAAFLLHDLGIESRRPEERAITINNRGFGRKHGFQGFRGHPALAALFGGGYIWDAPEDHSETRVGYFEDNWPKEGKVAAVDKSYITVNPGSKLLIEYTAGQGKILAVGGYVHFEKKNLLRPHLEQFTLDALRYLTGPAQNSPATYWVYDELKLQSFSISSPPLQPSQNRRLEARQPSPLLLTREPATENYTETAGRRCLIMGKETGEIDEVWVHPFRALRDLQIGVIEGDSVAWLKDLPARVEIRPEAVAQVYETHWGQITQIVFAALDQPGGMVHLSADSPQHLSLLIKFRCDLRWMWPYRENALGSLYYGYDAGLHALHVKDRSGDFYCLFGGDVPPSAHLQGQFDEIEWRSGPEGMDSYQFQGKETAENQVYAAWRFDLNSGNDYTLNIAVAGTDRGQAEAEQTYQSLLENPLDVYNRAAAHYQNLLASRTTIISPDSVFNEGYRWALAATERFFVHTPDLGSALMAGFGPTSRGWDGGHRVNGRPGYGWYFGRDGAWSGFALTACGEFEQVKAQLQFFAKFQDIDGKIVHELTSSGAAHYDAADSSPLYLVLAAHYLRASGDREFIQILWPSLKKALDFMYSTDTDGDGLIENTNVGHGWIEGGKLYGAHVTLYMAGCWAEALRSAAFIAAQLGEITLANQYRRDAEKVVEIIQRDFWNEQTRFLNYGKRIDGTYEESRTVLPAVLLGFNLIEEDKTKHMLEEWAGNGFSPDWGIRIISTDSPYFNPTGYHYGSVWPLFTGWAALAEYQYGRSVQGFTRIMNNLLIYRHWGLGYVEEVMHGMEYQPAGVCPHQCWSETNVLHPALSGMVGMEADAPQNRLGLKPRFPLHWDHASVKNIRVGGAVIDLEFRRENNLTTYQFRLPEGKAITVDLQPEIPEGMEITAIEIDGKSQPLSQRGKRGLPAAPVSFILKKAATVQYRHRGGIGMVPLVAQPQPGDSSGGYRIINARLEGNRYHVTLEGKSGGRGVFYLKTFGVSIKRAEGGDLKPASGEGVWKLAVRFDENAAGYSKKSLIVEW